MSVSLVKGQKISLSKESGGSLTKVVVGLGWDPADDDDDIDLDASAILFSESRDLIDAVWFGQLQSRDGSIVHTGDNLTGEGDGDDEQIIVNLPSVPGQVKHIVFVVTSYSGETFEEVENAFCRVVDQGTNRELARYSLSSGGANGGLVIARVYRHNDEWKMAAIGEYQSEGETYKDMVGLATRCI